VLEGDISGKVYRLQLPSKSFFGKPEGDKMPFQAYAKFLSGHSIPMSGVVTEARFDTSESVPVLTFKAVRPLSKQEYELARGQGKSEAALRAIETKFAEASKQPAAALPPTFTASNTPKVEEPETVTEPVKRESKKSEASAPVKPKDVDAVLAQWGSDDDE
jgi:hypothetical protein